MAAAWQFEFCLVPVSGLASDGEGIAFPGSLLEILDRLFPDSRMVGVSRVRWQNANGSFIEVFLEKDRVANIAVTLDLRVSCLTIVSELTLLANQQQWLAITADGKSFRPTVRRFIVEMQRSPAMRWIRGSLGAVSQATRIAGIGRATQDCGASGAREKRPARQPPRDLRGD